MARERAVPLLAGKRGRGDVSDRLVELLRPGALGDQGGDAEARDLDSSEDAVFQHGGRGALADRGPAAIETGALTGGLELLRLHQAKGASLIVTTDPEREENDARDTQAPLEPDRGPPKAASGGFGGPHP